LQTNLPGISRDHLRKTLKTTYLRWWMIFGLEFAGNIPDEPPDLLESIHSAAIFGLQAIGCYFEHPSLLKWGNPLAILTFK